MKLIYELDQANRAAFEAAGGKDEKILYCIPYEYEEHGMVDGYVVLTPTHLYKLRDGSLAAKWDMQRMSDFSVETLYGCGGFYGRLDGNAMLLCRFSNGKSSCRRQRRSNIRTEDRISRKIHTRCRLQGRKRRDRS